MVRMKKTILWMAALTLLVIAPVQAADTVKIKLATLAPKGTAWYDALMKMKQEWSQLSAGAVELVVYPGGVGGEESDYIRKMRVGQLQAASITTYGMDKVDKAIRAFSMPKTFANYEELDYVLGKLRPDLEKVLEQNGFVTLHWTDAGWLHFFSTKPVKTPEDLKSMKIATSPDVPEANDLWKAMGYQAVPLANSDILLGLQNGLVGAVSSAPLFALAQQWFGVAKYMTKISWVPVFGGTIVDKKAWDKISPDVQSKLRASAERIGQELKLVVRSDYTKTIEAMQKYGMTVVEVDPASDKAWDGFVAKGEQLAGGNIFDPAWLAKIRKTRDEYRATKGKK